MIRLLIALAAFIVIYSFTYNALISAIGAIVVWLIGYFGIWSRRKPKGESGANFSLNQKKSSRGVKGKGASSSSSRSGTTITSLSSTLNELLNRKNILIIDCETTGLGEDAVVFEVAVIDTTGDHVFHSYFQLPDGVKFEHGASQVTGFDEERLNRLEPPEFSSRWKELRTILLQAEQVLGWNVGFDERMLGQTLAYNQLVPVKVNFVDMRQMLKDSVLGGKSSLSKTAERLDIIASDSHTATGDVLTLLEIMRAVATPEGVERLIETSKRPMTERQSEYIDYLCESLDIYRAAVERHILDGRIADDVGSASIVINHLKEWEEDDLIGEAPQFLDKYRRH